jgi:hypothetical protein
VWSRQFSRPVRKIVVLGGASGDPVKGHDGAAPATTAARGDSIAGEVRRGVTAARLGSAAR